MLFADRTSAVDRLRPAQCNASNRAGRHAASVGTTQHDPAEAIESRRAGADHGPKDLDLVFAKLSISGPVSESSLEHSQRAACGVTLLTHRVGRLDTTTDGPTAGSKPGRAPRTVLRPDRHTHIPRIPRPLPIFSHHSLYVAPSLPYHAHASPNAAKIPKSHGTLRNAGQDQVVLVFRTDQEGLGPGEKPTNRAVADNFHGTNSRQFA